LNVGLRIAPAGAHSSNKFDTIDPAMNSLEARERKKIATSISKIAGQIYLHEKNGVLKSAEMYKLRVCLSKLQAVYESLLKGI